MSNILDQPAEDKSSELLVPLPVRFRTAFIIFSSERHRQIREQLAREGRSEKVSKAKNFCPPNGRILDLVAH